MSVLAPEPAADLATHPGDQPSVSDRRSLDDGELLAAWNEDADEDAFAALVERHGAMIATVCRCRSHPADVDDAVQMTLWTLATRSDSVRDPRHLAAWLHRVAFRSSTAVRRRKRPAEELDVDRHPCGDEGDLLEQIAKRHEIDVLGECLDTLPTGERAALVMRYYQSLSIAEIAERLTATPGSVRGRLQRGRRRLAALMRRRGVTPSLAIVATAAAVRSADAVHPRVPDVAPADDVPPDVTAPDPLPPLPLTRSWMMKSMFSGGLAVVAGALIWGVSASGREADGVGPSSTGGGNNRIIVDAEPPVERTVDGLTFTGGANEDPRPVSSESDSRRYHRRLLESPPIAAGDAGPEGLDHDDLESRIGVPVLVQPDAEGRRLSGLSLRPVEGFDNLADQITATLRRVGLAGRVTDDGLMITRDHAATLRRGEGSRRWVTPGANVGMDDLASLASYRLSVDYQQLPLTEAVRDIANRTGVSVHIDKTALEDAGLIGEEAVTGVFTEGAALDHLSALLRPLDLTLHVHDGSLWVTTRDHAEEQLIAAIYWLDDLVDHNRNAETFEPIVEMITRSIEPDVWEILGGSSTLYPAAGPRPGLVISTTAEVHEMVAMLLRGLRGLDDPPRAGAVQNAPPSNVSPATDPFGSDAATGTDPFGGPSALNRTEPAGETSTEKSFEAFGHQVDVAIGPNRFRDGDLIAIDEVRSKSSNLGPGDEVWVRGHARLATEPSATLGLYLTSDAADPNDIGSDQTMTISRGMALFELRTRIHDDGQLHLTFYNDDGLPFGGVYFGTAEQMNAIKHWTLSDYLPADSEHAGEGRTENR